MKVLTIKGHLNGAKESNCTLYAEANPSRHMRGKVWWSIKGVNRVFSGDPAKLKDGVDVDQIRFDGEQHIWHKTIDSEKDFINSVEGGV